MGTGILVMVGRQTMSLTSNEQAVLRAVGVFWSTVFSAAAFVVPRLLQAEKMRKESLKTGSKGTTRVHGSGHGGSYMFENLSKTAMESGCSPSTSASGSEHVTKETGGVSAEALEAK